MQQRGRKTEVNHQRDRVNDGGDERRRHDSRVKAQLFREHRQRTADQLREEDRHDHRQTYDQRDHRGHGHIAHDQAVEQHDLRKVRRRERHAAQKRYATFLEDDHQDIFEFDLAQRQRADNGNGSLMRIMPACLYCSVMESSGMYSDRDAIDVIHSVGGLTHAHIRSNIACGLYFFMAKYILFREGSLQERIQEGLTQGFAFYESYLADKENLHYYDRLKDLEAFKSLPADKIKSTGYVVDALEAAVWSLITTDSFDQALLKAVNLGDDTDTVGAIAGGLAGLYYGYDSIPEDWLSAIKRREWIEEMCEIQ